MESVEKIYCGDRDDSALTTAILANRNNDGYNNWMNNPFAYLMFMMIPAIWGGNGFNGNNNAVNAQLQSLQT